MAAGMRRSAAVAMCLMMGAGAYAQERVQPLEPQARPEQPAREAAPDSEGTRWIRESAAALTGARALRWNAEHRKEGNLPIPLGSATARMTLLKPEGTSANWIVRAEGKGNLKGGDPMEPFDVAWYMDQTQFIDSATGGVAVRQGRVNEMSLRLADSVRVKEMLSATPWRDEIARADAAVSGEESVDGVECVVVDITYRANKRTARIWIGKEDKLPRRFAQYVGASNQAAQFSAAFVTEFKGLEVEPSITRADVEIAPQIKEGRETFTIAADAPAGEGRTGAAPLVRSRPGSGEQGAGGAGEDQRQQAPARRADVELAPAFILKSADGSTVSLESLRGSVVVLDFWGTWSIPCKQSGPEVQALHERFKDRGVKVLGLAVRERSDEKPIMHFKEKGFTYTLLLGADEVAGLFGIRMYPAFVVIGQSGEIIHKQEKYVQGVTLEEIAAIVEKQISGETVKLPGG